MKKFSAGAQLQVNKRLLACAVIATVATVCLRTRRQNHHLRSAGVVATTSRVISNGSVAGYYQDGQGLFTGSCGPVMVHHYLRRRGASNTYAAASTKSEGSRGSTPKAASTTDFFAPQMER